MGPSTEPIPSDIASQIWNTSSEKDIVDITEAINKILQGGGMSELTAIERTHALKEEVIRQLKTIMEKEKRENPGGPKFIFSQVMDTDRLIGKAHIASYVQTDVLVSLSKEILSLMQECNSVITSMQDVSKPPIVKTTTIMMGNIPYLNHVVKNLPDFKNFLGALYMLFYDDAGERDLRVDMKYYTKKDANGDYLKGEDGHFIDIDDFVLFDIKDLRTAGGHDSEAWPKGEQKQQEIANVVERYTYKTSMYSLNAEELYEFQVQLLTRIKELLLKVKADLDEEENRRKREKQSAANAGGVS